MSEKKRNEEFIFDDSITVSENGGPVLGRLEGPCADIINPTRNGRKYSKEVWKKVFADPIIKEYFESGGIFGELGHPADRDETDMEKIAVCMPTPPQENSKGELIGKWDILNTPNGRILKCLCDYGYKVGVSSRGSGDTYPDADGNESVDAESYELKAFDIVLLPAVKSARLSAVNESLDTSNRKLKIALTEALNRATESEQKIMAETLDSLQIDYSTTIAEAEESANGVDIEATDTDTAVCDTKADVESELLESLAKNSELEKKVAELQESLSVSYAKETKATEEAEKYKKVVISLTESVKTASALKARVDTLTARVEESSKIVAAKDNQIADKDTLIAQLSESLSKRSGTSLKESMKASGQKISALTEENASLNEALQAERTSSKKKDETISSLSEQLEEQKKDSSLKVQQYSSKISEVKKLAEKYQRIARNATDKYIESKAIYLGVSSAEIKNRLPESYSFVDIDKACEEVRQYRVNIGSLPFDVSRRSDVKIKMNESADPLLKKLPGAATSADDEVDAQLSNLLRGIN